MSVAEFAEPGRGCMVPGVGERARRESQRPIARVDELPAAVFESDEEPDEFLADLDGFRHQNMAQREGAWRPRNRRLGEKR